MRPISNQTRIQIEALINQDLSTRTIASRLRLSHMTVSRVRSNANPATPRSVGGRPSKLSDSDKRRLARLVGSGTVETASQARQVLNNTSQVHVSSMTIRRALRQQGLRPVVKVKKPKLRPHHRKQRLQFARTHAHWTVEDWKKVIWSDETKINRLESDGRVWAWKRSGGCIQDHHVQGTVKHGGGHIMLWGCITAFGIGHFCKIEGMMNAEVYTDILNDELLNTMDMYHLDRDNTLFQQDNDPKHTSRLAKEWFTANGINVLEWPAQSPDLNPIENLWRTLKRKLQAYDAEPVGVLELWERVKVEWKTITQRQCLDLIESMPARVHAVLTAKGGHTKY
jgi:transposase